MRLIATDLDGTIVRSDGSISERTRDALAAAEDAGLVVVFVTGRPPRWMKPVSEATGHRGLAVCANGAIVYDLHTERIVQEFPIDVDVARRLVTALRNALPEVVLLGEQGGGAFDLEGELTEPVVKILARHEGMSVDDLHARAHEVIGELAELVTITYGGTEGLMEVSAAGVTKAFGLERLAAEHGVDAADVVAFGDMPNDLPMLTWAGHAVAVANAHPDVVAAADEVTGTNDEDGVAAVIERLLRSLSDLPG